MTRPRLYLTEEEQREARRRWTRKQNQKRYIASPPRWVHEDQHRTAPASVMEERDRALAHWRDPTAVMCGDPLPGRSALDRKRPKD